MIPARNRTRNPILAGLGLALLLAAPRASLLAQTPPPKPAPDVLILNDDEKLVGHFIRASRGDVRFKSDALGEVVVPWSKVKELRASGPYTIVGKDIKLGRGSDTSKLLKGSLDATAKEIVVTGAPGAPAATVAVADATHVIESKQFEQQVMHNPGLRENWNGSLHAGASLVEATQQSRSFNGGFSLARAVPMEAWLDPRDRTLVDFNFSSGVVKQKGAPENQNRHRPRRPGTRRVFLHPPHIWIRAGDFRSQLLAGPGPGVASRRRNRPYDPKERRQPAGRQGQHHLPEPALRRNRQSEQESGRFEFRRSVHPQVQARGRAGADVFAHADLEHHGRLAGQRFRHADRSGLQAAEHRDGRDRRLPEQPAAQLQEELVPVDHRSDVFVPVARLPDATDAAGRPARSTGEAASPGSNEFRARSLTSPATLPS